MQRLWHFYVMLLASATCFLVASCEKGQTITPPRVVEAKAASEAEIDDPTDRPPGFITKKGESSQGNQAPILDAPIDNISFDGDGDFGGGGGGGNGFGRQSSSPYRYPFLGGSGSGGGRDSNSESASMNMLLHWNQMAIDASGFDHNLPSNPSILAVREQMGPGRSSRAMAIVHIAIFEAINAIKGGYESYVGLPQLIEEASVDAAIATAAYDTLTELFPSQADRFAYEKSLDLQKVADSKAKDRGIELGHNAAEAILTLRANDGSNHAEPVVGVDFIPSDDPGKWRKDPISNIPVALGALWKEVEPFVMASADQFRAPPPPDLTSAEYAEAFDEVKSVGGDGVITPTIRTEEQTEIGLYWAYDGVPSLCAPPRLYNQIVVKFAQQEGTTMLELARLLALLNVAMADATLAIWESKYFYQLWRPVTGIREADPGTGPSLIGDNNPLTSGDVTFTPLGAPASNIPNGIDFTPPFPAYPSGHAGMGGATFEILRKFYNTDEIDFTFVSDELNGITLDADGSVRPLRPRTFSSFSQMEEENGQSRMYLGIHWAFDKTKGIAQGNQVADYVWDRIFKPIDN